MVPQFNIDKILNLNRDRNYREYVKESVKRSMGAGSIERSLGTSQSRTGSQSGSLFHQPASFSNQKSNHAAAAQKRKENIEKVIQKHGAANK